MTAEALLNMIQILIDNNTQTVRLPNYHDCYIINCTSEQAAEVAKIIAKSKRPINLLIRVEPGSEVTP